MKRTLPIGRSQPARIATAALVLVASVLAGCPLPQPVPAIEGSVTVTPPRILTQTVQPDDTVVRVGTSCAADQSVPFGGFIDAADLDEIVEARWFVDYSAEAPGVQQNDFPAAAPQGTVTQRPLADFRFFPARFSPGTHVVEVVVSNGFYAIGRDPAGAVAPNRSPQPGFETQVFRWVVQHADGGRCE